MKEIVVCLAVLGGTLLLAYMYKGFFYARGSCAKCFAADTEEKASTSVFYKRNRLFKNY